MSLKVVEKVPTLSLAAYAAGDCVGGLLEFADVCSAFQPSGYIVGADLIDLDSEAALIYLHLFDRAITAPIDADEFAPSDASLARHLGTIAFAVADYRAFQNSSICSYAGLKIPFVLNAGETSLYGVLVTEGTPTYAAITDLRVKLFIERS